MTKGLARARVGKATPANSRGSLSRGMGEPPFPPHPTALPASDPSPRPSTLGVPSVQEQRPRRQWGLCPHKDHSFSPASTLPSFQDSKQIYFFLPSSSQLSGLSWELGQWGARFCWEAGRRGVESTALRRKGDAASGSRPSFPRPGQL